MALCLLYWFLLKSTPVPEEVCPPILATSGQFFTLPLPNSLLKPLQTLIPPFQLISLWKGNDIYWLLTVCLTMLICLYLVISTKYLNKIYFLSVCIFDISKMWNSISVKFYKWPRTQMYFNKHNLSPILVLRRICFLSLTNLDLIAQTPLVSCTSNL